MNINMDDDVYADVTRCQNRVICRLLMISDNSAWQQKKKGGPAQQQPYDIVKLKMKIDLFFLCFYKKETRTVRPFSFNS